ncbi:uncharacterized protein LOC127850675 isoform X1 [Dreissena polymorpha]|uniref:uncharacterized protein LOC127850675 isoform X1 n=2 Tax=Dreissena polymorpha TaxID=45954 RepID=UPI0022642D54|nr:uncharacterized protein LOC127850675 isoform X1 [Dreissena polymorpha]
MSEYGTISRQWTSDLKTHGLNMGEYMDFGLLYLLTQRFYLICYRYILHLCSNILCWKYPNIVENKVPTRKNSSDERQARNQQNCEQLLKKAQSEIDILRSEKQVLESEKQDALSRDQNHTRVQQQLEDLLKKAQSEIDRLHAEKQVLESEKQDALNRLSTLMSSKLRDNNPNIADLSDKFRPTKIGEQFTELYDNEWTDAFSVLEQQYTEKQGITFLLDIIMEAYVFCEQELTAS